ncbi:retrovirus-related pol polyprotein from transposon TNT 1-94 [Tanacetum coccineum]
MFQQGEDPIECINKAMTFLSAIASRFPLLNNQLRTSSNPRNQATIQDGRVTVQQVQGRQNQSYAGTGNRGIATTSKGNYVASQPRVVKCYNCQGEGHMARQCTQPKRPRNAAWFKEKLMLAEAQETGQILDEEKLAFVADPGISEATVAQLTIPQNSAFQTEDLNAYDSDCDDLSSAKADVQEMQYSEQTHIDDFQESQDAAIQDTNSSALNDLLVLSLVEQITDHVAHLDKENETNKMLNKIKEDFGKRFVTQKELSAEQSFWLKHSSFSETPVMSHTPVRIESPSELPKSVENSDLNAQLQEKIFANAALKNELRKLKRKNVVDTSVSKPNATIASGIFKLDIEPISPRLKNNRDAHEVYIEKTIEYTDTLRRFVKRARTQNPSEPLLESTCMFIKHVQELCPLTRITLNKIVPPKETTSAPVATPTSGILVYSRRPKATRYVGSSSKVKIVESKTSNPKEPKQSWGSTVSNVPSSSLNDCRFRNDHIAKIMVYGDYQIGNVTISQVYYVEGLGHNVFFMGQFFDSDLEVAFRKHTYFIRDLNSVDLLKGSRGLNLYTLSVEDLLLSSPICLLSKASKTKSCLWHRRLSHLNFDYITSFAKQGLVRGLTKLKYQKDHLCSAYALGKRKKHSHKPKAEESIQEKLYLLHMDLCGPMRVQSINRRNYILVIVDDFSRFTWVKFLHSKDEVPEFVIKFLKMIQVRPNVTVCNIRTDNGTEFVNQTLRDYYEEVRISHQTLVARTP